MLRPVFGFPGRARADAGRETLFGRNFDVPSYGSLDRMVMGRGLPPGEAACLCLGNWPGFIGVLSGMNDAGLAVACLDSGPAKDDSPAFALGTPLSLTFRRILEECGTIDKAQKAAGDGQEHHLDEPGRLRPAAGRGAGDHAEKRRGAAGRGPPAGLYQPFPHARAGPARKWWRYRVLEGYWEEVGPFDWHDVAGAMDKVNVGQATTQTMIFEPKALRLRLSVGKAPTLRGPFVPLDLAAPSTQGGRRAKAGDREVVLNRESMMETARTGRSCDGAWPSRCWRKQSRPGCDSIAASAPLSSTRRPRCSGQIHHMFWSLPLLLIVPFVWRKPRLSGAIAGRQPGIHRQRSGCTISWCCP